MMMWATSSPLQYQGALLLRLFCGKKYQAVDLQAQRQLGRAGLLQATFFMRLKNNGNVGRRTAPSGQDITRHIRTADRCLMPMLMMMAIFLLAVSRGDAYIHILTCAVAVR